MPFKHVSPRNDPFHASPLNGPFKHASPQSGPFHLSHSSPRHRHLADGKFESRNNCFSSTFMCEGAPNFITNTGHLRRPLDQPSWRPAAGPITYLSPSLLMSASPPPLSHFPASHPTPFCHPAYLSRHPPYPLPCCPAFHPTPSLSPSLLILVPPLPVTQLPILPHLSHLDSIRLLPYPPASPTSHYHPTLLTI